MDRPWGMIKVSIFSFKIFGDFNELLVNSVLLAAYIDAASIIITIIECLFARSRPNTIYGYTR